MCRFLRARSLSKMKCGLLSGGGVGAVDDGIRPHTAVPYVGWESSCCHNNIYREQSRRCVLCYQSHRAAVRRQTDRKVALSLKKLRVSKRSGGRKVARRNRALEWPACRRGLTGMSSVVARWSRDSPRFRPACVSPRPGSRR
jgi:hypothetical protein